jgi:hypothetical protein
MVPPPEKPGVRIVMLLAPVARSTTASWPPAYAYTK